MQLALGYHDVVPRAQRPTSGFEGPGPDRYKVTPEAFAAHLEAIEAAGAVPGSVVDGAPLLLTFDDGGRAALDHTAPLLGDRPGHFFVVSDLIGARGFLSADGIRELAAAGHVVGSHSASHRIMSRLDASTVRDEWRRSRAALEDVLAAPVVTAAVPRGYAPGRVLRAAAEAGYEHVFTSEPWTRPRAVGGAAAHGRLPVTEATSPEDVAALVRGDRLALARVAVAWYARKGAKAAAGPLYERARTAVLRKRGRAGPGTG